MISRIAFMGLVIDVGRLEFDNPVVGLMFVSQTIIAGLVAERGWFS